MSGAGDCGKWGVTISWVQDFLLGEMKRFWNSIVVVIVQHRECPYCHRIAIWMNMEDIMLSDINRSQKDKYCVTLLRCVCVCMFVCVKVAQSCLTL